MLEAMVEGRDVMSVYNDNPGILDRQVELGTYNFGIWLVILTISSFLIRQCGIVGNDVNARLQEANQKRISWRLWRMSEIAVFVVVALMTRSAASGLLWANFPLIFVMQYKINRLPKVSTNQRLKKEA